MSCQTLIDKEKGKTLTSLESSVSVVGKAVDTVRQEVSKTETMRNFIILKFYVCYQAGPH